jgi:hypothetical protein
MSVGRSEERSLASRESEPTVVPIWFAVWCLVVAAIWLAPSHLIDRFVVGPLVDDYLSGVVSERGVSERDVASMHVLFVQQVRIGASAIAVLYLLARALTARWRQREVPA